MSPSTEKPQPIAYKPSGDRVEIEVGLDGAPTNASFELLLLDRDEVVSPWYFTAGPTHIDGKPFPVYLLDLPASDIDGLVVRCIGRLGMKPSKGTRMRLVFWQGHKVIGQAVSEDADGVAITVPVNFAGQFQ
jgi:hypothetical protein